MLINRSLGCQHLKKFQNAGTYLCRMDPMLLGFSAIQLNPFDWNDLPFGYTYLLHRPLDHSLQGLGQLYLIFELLYVCISAGCHHDPDMPDRVILIKPDWP